MFQLSRFSIPSTLVPSQQFKVTVNPKHQTQTISRRASPWTAEQVTMLFSNSATLPAHSPRQVKHRMAGLPHIRLQSPPVPPCQPWETCPLLQTNVCDYWHVPVFKLKTTQCLLSHIHLHPNFFPFFIFYFSFILFINAGRFIFKSA